MASFADGAASMYDMFARSQQQILDEWAKAMAAFQEGVQAMDPTQTVSENTREAFKAYESWKQSSGKYLDILMSACPGNAGTDTFSKVFRAADAFTRLYEIWEPLAKALQKQALDADSFKDLWDPAKYSETIDKIFGFGTPSAAAGLSGNVSDLLETWGARGEQFVKPWAEALRTNVDASLAAQAGDPEAATEVFRGLYAAFDRTFGKFLTMPAVGKDREQVELLSRTIHRYGIYLAKSNELQRQMHRIAQQAMERVGETMAQKVDNGEPIKGFGDFVQLWTKTNEEAFLGFFRTEEFSQLQGVVMEAALDCRKQFHELMEAVLGDLPIALRSEMDDVSRTNYMLNKSVRALKKKCSEIDEMREEIKQLQKKAAALEKKLAAAKSTADRGQREEVAS
jgi:class III poly(R)-hydroxyalkanoic acid synthase PhaE subunit